MQGCNLKWAVPHNPFEVSIIFQLKVKHTLYYQLGCVFNLNKLDGGFKLFKLGLMCLKMVPQSVGENFLQENRTRFTLFKGKVA